ncbi:uncharacterized protein SCHCODRAFT_01040298, partial [Schizophyllum commune H4-8]
MNCVGYQYVYACVLGFVLLLRPRPSPLHHPLLPCVAPPPRLASPRLTPLPPSSPRPGVQSPSPLESGRGLAMCRGTQLVAPTTTPSPH